MTFIDFSSLPFKDFESLPQYTADFGLATYCLVGLGSLVLWYVVSAVYAWNRLRSFPTPSFLASFSYLWLARTTYSGKQYWVHRELHRKYGPLVRIGPNEIMTDDPEIIKKISSARSSYHRGGWYTTGRFNPYHDNMFSLLDPASHSKAKSRTAAAYGGRDVPAVEPGVDDQVNTLVDLIRKKYASPAADLPRPLLDLGPLSCYFTMDVITRLAFGHEFGYLKEETDLYRFLGEVHDLWPQMSTCADVPWIRKVLFSPAFLKLLGPKSTDKSGFGALMAVAEHYVRKRFAPGAKQEKDMLDSFIRHGLNQQECEVEGLFMIVAGTESTAGAIRSALIHVITCPPVYYKLKEEIKTAVSEGRASSPIQVEEAKKIPYLQAVIYEGLRMRTPLLGLFPKVVPKGGDEFLGQHIPGGTSICMNTSSLLRSTSLFGPDADVFRPERFMELDKAARTEMERAVELAFGYGQHMCVGKNVAFMELNKAVFELLRHFDFQLLSPIKPCDTLSYGVFLEENLLLKVSEARVQE
ncbi:pisatin demethylase [Colletotrichum cereale]|nr:pisatin demethylase [Colletotrichum cereale]